MRRKVVQSDVDFVGSVCWFDALVHAFCEFPERKAFPPLPLEQRQLGTLRVDAQGFVIEDVHAGS